MMLVAIVILNLKWYDYIAIVAIIVVTIIDLVYKQNQPTRGNTLYDTKGFARDRAQRTVTTATAATLAGRKTASATMQPEQLVASPWLSGLI